MLTKPFETLATLKKAKAHLQCSTEPPAEVECLVDAAIESLKKEASLTMERLGAAEMIQQYLDGKINLYEVCEMIAIAFGSVK